MLFTTKQAEKTVGCNQIAIFEHVVANYQKKHDAASCDFEVLVAVLKMWDVCLACGTGSVAKGEKRILYNPGAVHLVPVLRSVMNDFFNKDDVDRVIPPHDVVCTLVSQVPSSVVYSTRYRSYNLSSSSHAN